VFTGSSQSIQFTSLYCALYCFFFQNEEFTIYSDYAENYMEAVMMLDKLVSKPGAPEYLGVSENYMFVFNC